MLNLFRKMLSYSILGFSLMWAQCAVASTLHTQLDSKTLIEERVEEENKVLPNSFAITLYKQNYIMPFYFTEHPYQSIYLDKTPHDERIKSAEIKYQLSFKVPVWHNILHSKTSLYFAYTQLAYWQAYNKAAFFRETDYQPEIFISYETNLRILSNLNINQINLGLNHQSNGFGSVEERSWNRVYIEAIASSPTLMISVRPWYVFHDATYHRYNPDMAKYLGYGELILALKLADQVFTLSTHGLLERRSHYASGTLTYSFPLTKHLNGFVQAFSGYGQSLIEYNHRTNSIGLGISLNDII